MFSPYLSETLRIISSPSLRGIITFSTRASSETNVLKSRIPFVSLIGKFIFV